MNIVYLKEKRDECLSKLERHSSRIYLQEFLSIYNQTKKQNKKQRELLKEFQYAIREIRDWTVDKIKEQHFLFNRQCDVFDNLVRSIFKLHLAIYNSMNESNFDAAIPNAGQYLHETFLSIARRLWKEPYLLYDVKVDKMTYQKNMLRLEKIIRKCLRETFVFMLPFKEFDEKLANENDDEDEEDYELVEDEDAMSEDDDEDDPMEEVAQEQSEQDEKEDEENSQQQEEEEQSQQEDEENSQQQEEEEEQSSQQQEEEEQSQQQDEEQQQKPAHEDEEEQPEQQKPEEEEQEQQIDPNIRIIQLPVRRTLAERKRLVKEKVKQRGFPEFAQARPSDSFF